MSATVEDVLDTFDHLSEEEKRRVVSEIIRRMSTSDLPALTDEDLVLNAEALFVELDDRESASEQS
ncbi:MAG: hypothetical protein AABO41_24305 [Acidobacteriota bacterium]